MLPQRGVKWPFGASVVAAATCGFRGLRDFFAGELVGQVAELGEHLLQPHFGAGRDFPLHLGGVFGRAVGLDDFDFFGQLHLQVGGERGAEAGGHEAQRVGVRLRPLAVDFRVEIFGFSEPRIFFTGFEKVISIGVEAEMVEPAVGVAAIVGLPVAGNQVTDLNLPGRSQWLDRGGDDHLAGDGLFAERERVARLVEVAVLQLPGLAVDDLARPAGRSGRRASCPSSR